MVLLGLIGYAHAHTLTQMSFVWGCANKIDASVSGSGRTLELAARKMDVPGGARRLGFIRFSFSLKWKWEISVKKQH